MQFKKYKEHLHLNNKINITLKSAKNQNRFFTGEDAQTANKYKKKCCIFSQLRDADQDYSEIL